MRGFGSRHDPPLLKIAAKVTTCIPGFADHFWNGDPPVLQGRCSAVSDFIGRCEGKFMEIPAKIQIKHLGNLERIHRQNLKFIDQADVRGVWILRAPGVGKIHFARQVLVAEGYYPTLNNKWWDGYQSQKVVIMEDVDKETVKFLHHHLKIWGFGRSPMVFGVWEGVGGGRPFFQNQSFLLEQRPPSITRERCSNLRPDIGGFGV